MADHQRPDLDVPDALRADDVVVDRRARRPEQVAPVPERIGGQEGHGLALEREQGEVVRDDVRHGDRREGVDELTGQLGGRMFTVHAVHTHHAEAVEAGDDQHRRYEADRRGELKRGRRGEAEVEEGLLEVVGQVGPRPALAEAVEARGPDGDAQQRDRARDRVEARQPRQRPPEIEHAVAPFPYRQARDDAEVGAERVGPVAPLVDPVEAHAGQLHGRVGEREQREGRRVVAALVGQLDPREAQQPERGRPAAEAAPDSAEATAARPRTGAGRPRPRPAPRSATARRPRTRCRTAGSRPPARPRR